MTVEGLARGQFSGGKRNGRRRGDACRASGQKLRARRDPAAAHADGPKGIKCAVGTFDFSLSGYALVRGGRPALTHRAEIPFIHRSWQVMNACTPPLPGCGAEQDDGAVMRMVGCVGVPRGHFDGGEGDTALEALSRVTPKRGQSVGWRHEHPDDHRQEVVGILYRTR